MRRRILRILSIVFVFGGLILIANTTWPILSYELFSSPGYTRFKLLSPVPSENSYESSRSQNNIQLDYTKADNWFVGAPSLPESPSKIRYYNLSIPKLKIDGAAVEVGGDDLSKNLIHYKGTALPGKLGNSVVFGHSTLPQLYDPKNYLSIFTKLPTLQKGDRIQVDYDGIVYTYQIEEMYEVQPNDFSVLEQKRDDSYLSIITCVPPGTYLRRLVVNSRLVPPER